MKQFSVCASLVVSLLTSLAGGSILREVQVLVVYDSRVAASVEVAEFYAGSEKVPGGTGGEAGVRPRVEVFDIASSGLPASAVNGTMTYSAYLAEIRDPIRAHLEANGLVYRIRCIVLCKGLPHRIDDPGSPGAGDTPSQLANLFGNGLARLASVDSELTMLWQNLNEIFIDIFRTADRGYVLNPYWRASRPINSWTNKNIRADKAWRWIQAGKLSTTFHDDPVADLTPGDIMLVTRLDGHSVADVRAMVERAQGLVYDVDDSAFVLDESDSNGIADDQPNSELDNVDDYLRHDDDYETTRDVLLEDGRFDPEKIHYDPNRMVANFLLGPNVDFGGQGRVIEDDLILLTHYGRNHIGRPSINIDRYEESFNLAPGAIFNTMESYNGRAFNGLGTLIQQAQVADFIGAGGTFGIGMVWEPLAQSVPDSNRIVRNFVLGGLTWAEAAYTAIPCLSWMHVVVGDPLARSITSIEDINGDGVVDIEDLYAWERNPIDLNRDGVADDVDRQILINTIRVPFEESHQAGRR